MKNILKNSIQFTTGIAAFTTIIAGKALALSAKEGAEAAKTAEMPSELIGPNGTFTQMTNTMLFAIGIVCVVMIIWGGLRYVVSGGDSKKVTDAKNTILYAIIGLIISLLSYAIVNFVITAISVKK